MMKETLSFAVESKNGVVTSVGRSSVLVPKTNFKGGSIKWYEDQPKKKLYEVDFLKNGVCQSHIVKTSKSPVEIGHYYRDVKHVDHVTGITVATADSMKPGKPIVTI